MADAQKLHFDKRIPITVLITLTINLLGVIWYASGIESRIRSLEKSTANNQVVVERLVREATANNQVVVERLVRVETHMEGLTKAIERILNK